VCHNGEKRESSGHIEGGPRKPVAAAHRIAQWGKLGWQIRVHQLEYSRGLWEITQPPDPQITEGPSRGQVILD